jgi:hypothetical protein
LKNLSDKDDDDVKIEQSSKYLLYNTHETLRSTFSMISSRFGSVERWRVVRYDIGRVMPTARLDFRHKIVQLCKDNSSSNNRN